MIKQQYCAFQKGPISRRAQEIFQLQISVHNASGKIQHRDFPIWIRFEKQKEIYGAARFVKWWISTCTLKAIFAARINILLVFA